MRLLAALALLLLLPAATAQVGMGNAILQVEDVQFDASRPMESGETREVRFTAVRVCSSPTQVLPAARIAWHVQGPPMLLATGAEPQAFPEQRCAQSPEARLDFAARLSYTEQGNGTGKPVAVPVRFASEYSGGGGIGGGYAEEVQFDLAVPLNTTAAVVKAVDAREGEAAPGGFVVAPALALAGLLLRRRTA